MLSSVVRVSKALTNAVKPSLRSSRCLASLRSSVAPKLVQKWSSNQWLKRAFMQARVYTSGEISFLSHARSEASAKPVLPSFSTNSALGVMYWPFELEEVDFKMSNYEPEPTVLSSESELSTSAESVFKDRGAPLEEGEDDVEEEGGEQEPKTFEELFGAAYEAEQSEKDPSFQSKKLEWQMKRNLAAIEEYSVMEGRLYRAEAKFTYLFKQQSKMQSESDLVYHKMARVGWRSMINGYVLQGTEEQLDWFLETYSAMYGLHDNDKALIRLKFQLSRGNISRAHEIWQQAIEEEKIDDRGYSVLAKGYNLQGQNDRAIEVLDLAWMKALSDSNFKITNVFYQTSAENFISTLDLPRLTDLFIRLNANKPELDANFFMSLFRALNSMTGVNSVIIKTPEKIDLQKPNPSKVTLTKMYDMIESSMSKFPITVTTKLRNEMIAFKLYNESDFEAMFKTISKYATIPDTRMLNLLMDALIREGKAKTASMLCDAWDAQYGIKPNHQTSHIVSSYLVYFSKMPIVEAAALEPKTSTNTFSSLYSGTLPALVLFDELVLPNRGIVLQDAAIVAFCSYICELETNFTKPTPGVSLLVSYLISQQYPKLLTKQNPFYQVIKQLFHHGHSQSALDLVAFCDDYFSLNPIKYHILSLPFYWSKTFETPKQTSARWHQVLQKLGFGASLPQEGDQNISDTVEEGAHSMVLQETKKQGKKKDLIPATLALPYARFLTGQARFYNEREQYLKLVLEGHVQLVEAIFATTLLLLHKQHPSKWNPEPFWNLLKRIRRDAHIQFNYFNASQIALLLSMRADSHLPPDLSQQVKTTMAPFRNDERWKRGAIVMPPQLQSELRAALDIVRPLFYDHKIAHPRFSPNTKVDANL